MNILKKMDNLLYNLNQSNLRKTLPFNDLIWFLPYGAEEKLPQNMKQVGGMAEYPTKAQKETVNSADNNNLHCS